MNCDQFVRICAKEVFWYLIWSLKVITVLKHVSAGFNNSCIDDIKFLVSILIFEDDNSFKVCSHKFKELVYRCYISFLQTGF